MVARGFKRNTHWKGVKAKVEKVMGTSNVAYKRVKVIGHVVSFAVIILMHTTRNRERMERR